MCPSCSIYLTYHKSINKLICHHCGIKVKRDNYCKVEKNLCVFRMYGPGVEKIYEELNVIFPKKNIKIFSSDFLSKKNETENNFVIKFVQHKKAFKIINIKQNANLNRNSKKKIKQN